MHKLILSFKGRIQKIFIPETDQCRIGRQADCDIQIDNLAVAPVHANIHFCGENVALDIVSTESPVLLNNKKPDKNTNIEINRGDEISIGKHMISYHWENKVGENDTSENTVGEEVPSTTGELTPHSTQNAWLQILSGPKMGRTMQLTKPRLKIGSSTNKGAMITSRHDGYYLSALDDTHSVMLDNHCIQDDSVNLQDGNTIQVGDMEILFFIQD